MIRERLSFYFILGWCLVTFIWLPASASLFFRRYATLWGLDLEEKKRYLDRDLYDVAKVCEREIPPTEPLFFYALSASDPETNAIVSTPLLLEHDRQKISYFLYPRRVYWERKRIKEPLRYILVYHARLEVPGFEHLIDLSNDIYLLKIKMKEK